VHFRFRYRDSIVILDTWDGIVIVSPISGIAQHYFRGAGGQFKSCCYHLASQSRRCKFTWRLKHFIALLTRPRYIGERGIVFDRFVCLFVYIFVPLLARLRENGWTNLHEIFREGAELPWDDLIQFWVKSEKPRDAAILISFTSFVNITSKRLDRFAQIFQGRCGVTMAQPDYIFGQFWETARCHDAQHGDGVCCAFEPQLVFDLMLNQ